MTKAGQHFVPEGLGGPFRSLHFPSMPSRWKDDRPMSRQKFGELLPNDDACAKHLAELRWGEGFVCPACSGTKGW